jgi:hypothetical protein
MDDEQQANKANNAIRLTNTWAGRTVTIRGAGGIIHIDPEDDDSPVKTGSDATTHIVIERAPTALGLPGTVAFRVAGSHKYLTTIMYGDSHRQKAAESLAAFQSLLPEHIPKIVDYAVDRPTDETNFEGAGYNYSPMTTQEGPPTKLQLFELEGVPADRNRLGVKSLFGTYWRSQHWDNIVSQSPHLLGDETWYFSVQKESTNNPDLS